MRRVIGLLLVLGLATPVAAQRNSPAPFRIQNEGTALAARPILNFVGTAVDCVVDGTRITCTFTGGTFAPTDAQYWTGAADGTLSAEKNLGALSTGLVINTSGTPSAYAGTSCTNQFPRSLNASGAATCASVALASDVSGSLPLGNLTLGSANQYLRMNSAGNAATWTFTTVPILISLCDAGGCAPLAATTYYGFAAGLDPGTSASSGGVAVGIDIPHAGTINRVTTQMYVLGTNGVNGENMTFSLRKNDTTDSSTIATFDTDVDAYSNTVTTLNFSVAQGDKLVVKIVTPAAWTTAPTVIVYMLTIVLETP